MVLLLTVLVSLVSLVTKGLVNKRYIQDLAQKPFAVLQGMVENGRWGDPSQTRSSHPNLRSRNLAQDIRQ